MRRRWSGIFAVLALAQLSLGGAAPRCPAPQPILRDATAQHEHVRNLAGERADGRVAHDVTNCGDAPTCGHAARGVCMGMTCSVVVASGESSPLASAADLQQVQPLVLDFAPGPNPAPEPPPPRI